MRRWIPALAAVALMATPPGPTRAGTSEGPPPAPVRVRGLGGGLVSSGSGIAVTPGLVLTASHVVAGGTVARVGVGEVVAGDAAVVAVDESLDLSLASLRPPVLEPMAFADTDPGPGTDVRVSGVTSTGVVLARSGTVRDVVDGSLRGVAGPVLRLALGEVVAGVSGAPVTTGDGRVVGMVFAVEETTGLTLAVPVSTLRRRAAVELQHRRTRLTTDLVRWLTSALAAAAPDEDPATA